MVVAQEGCANEMIPLTLFVSALMHSIFAASPLTIRPEIVAEHKITLKFVAMTPTSIVSK